MSADDALASWVDLEGCYNFRDLGGYQTGDGRRFRTGRVFRSDGLQHLTEGDLERLTGEIGLATVIDLRSDQEVEDVGRGAIAERATILHIPLFPGAASGGAGNREALEGIGDMGDLYFMMLGFAQEPIARVVRVLADSEAPAVFHCAAGKDRTGVISAVLLSLVGVPRETIIADYALSRRNIDLINARLNSADSYQRIMDDLPEGAYDADPSCMENFLRRVDETHGSIEGWAEGAGLGGEVRERLQERLLD